MHIKYSPCNSNKDTVITIKSLIAPEVINIDGREIGPFDADGVQWPDIAKETDGAVLEAHRDSSGDLYLTIQRQYTGSCLQWDDCEYHEYKAGDSI